MSFVVDGLMFAGAFGERCNTPVGEGADRATGGEDEGAGCAGDAWVSVRMWIGVE